MRAYVITILGLPISEQGGRDCIESGILQGLEIEVFPATTKFDALREMQSRGLAINHNIYQGISDDQIREFDAGHRQWWITTPELGCLISHYKLWQMVVAQNEPFAIFEHDAVLRKPLPCLSNDELAVSLHLPRKHGYGTIAYLISPEAARLAINELEHAGAQPADELLWRAALADDDVQIRHEDVVSYQETDISTIQYACQDLSGEDVEKAYPWTNFVNLNS